MSDWTVTPREAIDIQKRLAKHVQLEPLRTEPKTVGGCDVSMSRFAPDGYAGFVTLSYPNLETLAEGVAHADIPFPYVPGLLSFREIPMLMQAWERLPVKPDVLMVDGVGIAHPRRLGIATHLGLVLDIPTIGCAKNVLYGKYEEPEPEAGSSRPLIDPKDGTEIGVALRTRRGARPLFISPGHKITLADAERLVRACVKGYRLPEPTRRAHLLVNRERSVTQNV